MSPSIQARLDQLGIVLDVPAAPVANYVPAVQNGALVFVSGQIPIQKGQVMYTGRLSDNVSVETGQQAARLCAVNILCQLKALIGDLDRVEACVRLGGFVSCTPDFYDHAVVMNGASDLMVQVFGDKGRHCRAAIGCSSLPLNSAVEVEALFQVTPS